MLHHLQAKDRDLINQASVLESKIKKVDEECPEDGCDIMPIVRTVAMLQLRGPMLAVLAAAVAGQVQESTWIQQGCKAQGSSNPAVSVALLPKS